MPHFFFLWIIIVGFRDDHGKVRELKTYETKTIHRLVRAPKGNGQGYWEPTVCFNFGKGVLEWCLQAMSAQPAGRQMVMRYEPAQAVVTLVAAEGDAAAGGAPPSASGADLGRVASWSQEDAPGAKRPRS